MERSRKRSRMGQDRGRRPRCFWSVVGSVARWAEIRVADLGVWSAVGSVDGWGEIGVADPGVWSVVKGGEFGVTDLGFLCLEPPSLAGP